MKHENYHERFYIFYLLVLSMMNGLFFSGNMMTMYLFFELMTLVSLPLVLHSLTKESISAGLKYLFYSVGGAFLALLSHFTVAKFSDTDLFIPGGVINTVKSAGHEQLLLVGLFLAIIGFGAKAGMFPLHGWLPTAHPVAPAPASAVLSGVITKAGVFCIFRLVFYLYGADMVRGTWVQYAWIILALITVFMGSMMAYKEKLLKRRFAYSTVSQVSYVLLGLACLSYDGVIGAMLHIVFHSVIKDGLFLCAGAIIYKTSHTYVSDLKGIGKQMPVTIWCYTIFALALTGIPPTSGFISKWFLASGALNAGIGAFEWLAPAVLLLSALLTAGYLLPITINGFFPGNDYDHSTPKCEANKIMLIPLIILAAASLILGLFPGGLIRFFSGIASSVI